MDTHGVYYKGIVMINLLSRVFIKNYNDVKNPAVRRAYGMLCGLVGIFLNLCLFTGKIIVGTLTSSIAISADAFNNLSDAGSSIITLFGFKLAGQAADNEHPYGHGRFEYISGLIVSLVIIVMGYELCQSSVTKIISPEETTFNYMAIIILAVSILVKLYMFLYNRLIAKRIDSEAMKATSTDSICDVTATSVVLIATLINHYSSLNIDGYCGLLVGIFILYSGIKSAKETISPLLGHPPTTELVSAIEKLVLSHENIVGLHDLLVHDYGPGRLMISLHAEVPADSDILEMHDTIDNIEHDLQRELGCSAVIHMDPIITSDEYTISLNKMVKDIIAEYDKDLTIHDFRIVSGPTHTNLIFDVVVPYSYKYSDAEVRTYIAQAIQQKDNAYRAVIEIDRPTVSR